MDFIIDDVDFKDNLEKVMKNFINRINRIGEDFDVEPKEIVEKSIIPALQEMVK